MLSPSDPTVGIAGFVHPILFRSPTALQTVSLCLYGFHVRKGFIEIARQTG